MKNFIYPSRIKDSNLGDVLINALLLREISKYGKVYIDGQIDSLFELITLDNPDKGNIVVIEGVNSFQGKPILRWFNLLRVIGDVSFVFDPPGAYSEGKNGAKAKIKYFKYYLRATILRKFFNIGMLRWGVSMGPFSDKSYIEQKNISNMYTDIAVRDSKNFTDLKNRGFKNLSLIDDLAFLYESSDFQSLIGKTVNKVSKRDYVVISLRGDVEGKTLKAAYLDAIAVNLINVLRDVHQENDEIILAYQVSEDLESLEYIQTILHNNGFLCELMSTQLNFANAIALYANAKFLFTNRLHVALLSILNDTVPVIITDVLTHHKLVNVFNDLNLSELIIDCRSESVIRFKKESKQIYLNDFRKSKQEKAKIIRNHFSKILS